MIECGQHEHWLADACDICDQNAAIRAEMQTEAEGRLALSILRKLKADQVIEVPAWGNHDETLAPFDAFGDVVHTTTLTPAELALFESLGEP